MARPALRHGRVLLAAALFLAAAPVARAESDEADAPDAPASPEAAPPVALSLGSGPGQLLEARVGVWLAKLEQRSGANLDARGQELRYTQDLGYPSYVALGHAAVELRLGRIGWVGGELIALPFGHSGARLERERELRGATLAPGDVLWSRGTLTWLRGCYGYEVRAAVRVDSILIELAVSPTIAVVFHDVDVSTRRVAPNPGPRERGHVLASTIAPGVVLQIEVARTLRLGCELEGIPPGGRWSVAPRKPALTDSERLRVFVGLRFLDVLEATVGFRYQRSSVCREDAGPDVKLRGIDFTVGLVF